MQWLVEHVFINFYLSRQLFGRMSGLKSRQSDAAA